MKSNKKIDELLKNNELSITRPRQIILQLLMEKHGPFCVEDIHKHIGKICDVATVYRTINQLVEKKLVIGHQLDLDSTLYEFNHPEHHHHHLICRICHKVETLHDCLVASFEKMLKKTGFREIEHRLEFIGTCERCAVK